MLRTRIKQNPRTHGTARGHHTWPDAFHLARGLQRLTPEEDGVDAAGDTLEDRRSTGNWGRRREDPIGERARTPSIPDNAFTAIATSPCKCSTGTKPSVRKDTFNVRPRLSLGRTCVIQAPFRSTVRVSLRASAADTTLPPRPGRQSSPHAQRARDDRAAGSQARGTLKKEEKKKSRALQVKRSVQTFGPKPCQVVDVVARPPCVERPLFSFKSSSRIPVLQYRHVGTCTAVRTTEPRILERICSSPT